MDSFNKTPQGDSLLSTIGTFSGVASLILAVAGNNLERLSPLQQLGLAGASTVMLWAFMAGIIGRQFMTYRSSSKPANACFALFIGAWVGAGLLLAVIPLFSFGLPATSIATLSLWAAGLFAFIFTAAAALSITADFQ